MLPVISKATPAMLPDRSKESRMEKNQLRYHIWAGQRITPSHISEHISPIIAQIHKESGHRRPEVPEPLAHLGNTLEPFAALQVRKYVQHQRIIHAVEQAGIHPLWPGLHWGVLLLLLPIGLEAPALVLGYRGEKILSRNG